MNYKQTTENILKQCNNNGINLTDVSYNTLDENRKIFEGCGKNFKPVYSGEIHDGITLDTDITNKNGLIEIIVNGSSYRYDYDMTTGESLFSKAKLFLNGMYYCLDELERKPIKESTFKNAITRFFNRNSCK